MWLATLVYGKQARETGLGPSIMAPTTMSSRAQEHAPTQELLELQRQIEESVSSLRHPVVAENEEILFDLTVASWRLSVQFGKLLLEVWTSARTLARRVEAIAYGDEGRLGLFVRPSATRGSTTLEFRELRGP